MELMVLKKENETYHEMLNKLIEEVMEVRSEVIVIDDEEFGDKEKLAGEILDVIQVCIGLLDKLETEGMNIRKAVEKHNMKLLRRGWRYKEVIHLTRV